jgi:ABC-type transport system substrate-binding protein
MRRTSNPAFDDAYRATQSEMDPSRRLALLRRAASALHDDPAYLFLISPAVVWASSTPLKGLVARADGEPRLESLRKS